jgi:hypothetical protein
MFLAEQEAWREDLIKIATFVLQVSAGAVGDGSLREALIAVKNIEIRESRRITRKDGSWRYSEAAAKPSTIEVQVNFPAIREGDIPALITATVAAMTLGNTNGEVVGIDEKAGVKKMGEYLGLDDNQELVEDQYPEGEYNPNREEQKQAAADQAKELAAAKPAPMMPGSQPGQPGGKPAIKEAFARIAKVIESWK